MLWATPPISAGLVQALHVVPLAEFKVEEGAIFGSSVEATSESGSFIVVLSPPQGQVSHTASSLIDFEFREKYVTQDELMRRAEGSDGGAFNLNLPVTKA